MTERAIAPRNAEPPGRTLSETDPDVSLIIDREELRQREKIILIPSESRAPLAVRTALASAFTNIYAEGYPALRMTREETSRLADVEEQLAMHRRYADRRYYKGTEMVDIVEALARRRVAELFANDRVSADEIFANVQALSGAAANNAVYEALLRPGDTLLGLALNHGGHLTHGSPHNRSGKRYHALSYEVDPQTGRLDYERIRRLALEHQPSIVVAGASAYPWSIDWAALRSIVDEVPGALLLADIAHPAGLVVAGLFPNPVGYAHVITFTTHKTLCGPRGAVILTTDAALAERIDRSVFPGEQGGPHVNNIAAMAVAFRIAQSEEFRQFQRQIVANARALAGALQDRGHRLVFGGTDTHMLLIDLNAEKQPGGEALKADAASRILDIAGIVCNRNSIPGDTVAAQASGLRFGTVWATQRGFREAGMVEIADLIHRTLSGIVPYHYVGSSGNLGRGKMPFDQLRAIQRDVARLVDSLADKPARRAGEAIPAKSLSIEGPRAKSFLHEACSANLLDLGQGQARRSRVLTPDGTTVANVIVTRLPDDEAARERYTLSADQAKLAELSEWLTALSDGYVLLDRDDLYAKVEGPIVVKGSAAKPPAATQAGDGDIDLAKPYFVGQRALLVSGEVATGPKPLFEASAYTGPDRKSPLYDEHIRLSAGRALVPFAGWLMPVWYSSIREEHHAVRHTAALFDVSHMGVLEVAGPGAARFLDLVTTNYVPLLETGQSQYTFLLDADGHVIDDVLLYRRARDKFMLVANAANAERVESWLRAACSRRYLIDRRRPHVIVDSTADIRNFKDPTLADQGRVDLAVQGPESLRVLRQAVRDPALSREIAGLAKGEFLEAAFDGIPALFSRTGYTGEELGFELYVPPAAAPNIWRKLLTAGEPFGLKPAGLGARDSARTEAGFPLFGHELAGRFEISPLGAGYAPFVKLHKPFFVGRSELIAREAQRTREIVRFRLKNRGARMLRPGDPVLDQRGECIGHVTSSAVVDGLQIGMAFVTRDSASPGTPLWAFPMSRARGEVAVAKNLAVGDTAVLAEEAITLTRFGLPALG